MQEWIKTEVEHQVMGDNRLVKRLSTILDRLSVVPSKSIPNANDTWAETFGAYRFFENDKVNFDSIMSGHRQATLNRMKDYPVILVPQDTTFLNFATEAERKNMGTLRLKDSNQQLLHTSIAITPDRVNLGVVKASLWQRSETSTGKSRNKKPIEEKESYRWLAHYDETCDLQKAYPDTTVVSIADREGDIHEWFQHAENKPEDHRANFIVRAKANRAIELDNDERESLWNYIASAKKLGNYNLNVPKRNGEPGREATIDVSAEEVRIAGRGKSRRALNLQVVYAKERHPPEGTKGVEWLLLTDLVVESFEQARVVIEWYRSRWEIETYFRVLKGSCQIENNRFREDYRMMNCIAVYMIISWRLHSITKHSRKEPDAPCTQVYSGKEWTMIWIMKKKEKPPKVIPSIREITRMLASMGGFLGRKGDGEPGVKTIWEGYTKLLNYIEAAETLDLLG